MKVLLHADLPKLGYFGDVVEVAEGYARNYLLPQRLAVMPTNHAVKLIAAERAQKSEERRIAHERKVKVAEAVNGAVVSLTMRANEQGHLFGSVTEEQVAAALREKGFEIVAEYVNMGHHIREVGEHEVKLQLADAVTAKVKVEVLRLVEEGDAASEPADSNE